MVNQERSKKGKQRPNFVAGRKKKQHRRTGGRTSGNAEIHKGQTGKGNAVGRSERRKREGNVMSS